MEVVRANVLAKFNVDFALSPREVARMALKTASEIGGFIIPTRLLPDDTPDQQLATVTSWLSRRYLPQSEVACYSTPPGDEPLHTDRPDLLPGNTSLRLQLAC